MEGDREELNEEIRTKLLSARILHVSYTAAILVYVIIVALVRNGKLIDAPNLNENVVNYMWLILAVISVACLTGGAYIYRRMTRKATNLSSLVTAHLVRVAFFEGIAIFGLILGIVNVKWELIIPFFAIGALALALTYPTRERWTKTLERNVSTPGPKQ